MTGCDSRNFSCFANLQFIRTTYTTSVSSKCVNITYCGILSRRYLLAKRQQWKHQTLLQICAKLTIKTPEQWFIEKN